MRKNAYLHITESLCCTAEVNTTLQINYTSIKLKEKYSKNFCRKSSGLIQRLEVLISWCFLDLFWDFMKTDWYWSKSMESEKETELVASFETWMKLILKYSRTDPNISFSVGYQLITCGYLKLNNLKSYSSGMNPTIFQLMSLPIGEIYSTLVFLLQNYSIIPRLYETLVCPWLFSEPLKN